MDADERDQISKISVVRTVDVVLEMSDGKGGVVEVGSNKGQMASKSGRQGRL